MKNYTKENYGKDKNAWLNHRGIGGTSASAIVGLNPYQTKLDIYCAIENPKEEKDEATGERVDYGRKLEPLIRNNINANFSHKYKVRNPKGFEMYRRKDKPYMTATLDGTMTSLTDPNEKWVIEIKTHDMGDSEDMFHPVNSYPALSKPLPVRVYSLSMESPSMPGVLPVTSLLLPSKTISNLQGIHLA